MKVESPTRPDGMRFATVKPPTDPTGWSTAPRSTAPTRPSARSPSTSPPPRVATSCCGSSSTPTWSSRTSRRGCCGNVGLDYDDAVRAQRPTVVLLRMPAFGLDGPWRDRQRVRADHRAGVGHRVDDRRGRWIEALVRSTIDPIAGIHGAFAVLAALEHRDRTGRRPARRDADGRGRVERRRRADRHVVGVRRRCSNATATAGRRVRRRACTRARATSSGSRCRSRPTTSGARWCGCSGEPDVGDSTRRWRPAPAAGRTTTTSTPSWPTWFAGRDRDDTVDRLLAAGVHAAPVWDQMIQDELPQLAERGFTQWLEHPVAGLRRATRAPGSASDQFDNALPGAGAHRRPAHRRGPPREARPHRRRARRARRAGAIGPV